MSTRFLTNALTVAIGGAVVVFAMALGSIVGIGWIAFAGAVAIVVMSGLVQLDRQRGVPQRLLDFALMTVGGTLIVTSLVLSGPYVLWTSFALALGLVSLAFTGLVLHEIEMWRATHALDRLHGLAPQVVELDERRRVA